MDTVPRLRSGGIAATVAASSQRLARKMSETETPSTEVKPGYHSIYGRTAWTEECADGVEVSYGDGGVTVHSRAEFHELLRSGAARPIHLIT